MQDQPISRTRLLQEGRIMKFESTYEDWVGELIPSGQADITILLFDFVSLVAKLLFYQTI